MGAAASKIEIADEDGIDLGPQKALSLEPLLGCSFYLKSLPLKALVAARGFVLVAEEARGSGTAGVHFPEPFVLETGLCLRGCRERCSLRSLRRPLDYLVAQTDGQVVLSRYDGSEQLRTGATLEMRAPERDGLLDSLSSEGFSSHFVCLMLAERPGLYIATDKDGRLVIQKYTLRGREAFYFEMVNQGTAEMLVDLERPVLGPQNPKGSFVDLFAPSFSLPVPGDPGLEEAVRAALALEDAKTLPVFDPVD